MASQVEIYNMSLGYIGISDTIAGLEERSKARLMCTQYWDSALQTVLAAFPWPFATKFETLAMLSGVESSYGYTYQYPTDCLRALYLTAPGFRQPDESVQPRFEVVYGDSGRVILTDQAEAELAYVVLVSDTGRFPPMFTEALAWKLAAMVAMPMTNTRAIAEGAAASYKVAVQDAWAQALNESDFPSAHASEYITVRGA